MNGTLAYTELKIETNTEYTPDSLEILLSRYEFFCHIDENTFVYGRGHRKSREQQYYEKLKEYIGKLSEYVEEIRICGPERNSYSKTDHDATFMRMKKTIWGMTSSSLHTISRLKWLTSTLRWQMSCSTVQIWTVLTPDGKVL
ncbi:hypothetical protein CBFG_05791 [Clostridiales bacterium 1_7_47FAA]|nr:hypothetical protein CBFG_05791 [Clostridiales bacterium 1_7_47FAA]